MSAHVAEFIPTAFSIAGAAVDPAPANTGNGTVTGISGKEGAPAEVWTLTVITAAANGGTFSVVGSISGRQADATVGVAYDNGRIAFTINDGVVDFIVGDNFTITTTIGYAAEWKGNANEQGFHHAKELTFETQTGVTGNVEAAYTDNPAGADWKPLNPAVALTAGNHLTIAAPPAVKAMRVPGVTVASPPPVRLRGRLDI